MDRRPSTPSSQRRDYSHAPPSYFDIPNEHTPTMVNGGSSMRLLTTVENTERPYVSASTSAVPLKDPSLAPEKLNLPSPKRKSVNVRIVESEKPPSDMRRLSSSMEPSTGTDLEMSSTVAEVGVKEKSPRRRITVKGTIKKKCLPGTHDSPIAPAKSYQPSTVSYEPSIFDDAPVLPPPTEPIYSEFSSQRSTSPWSPSRTNSRASKRPPSRVQYEPADLNGSPRPGTPASAYGGSPERRASERRPLPPAPLFSIPLSGSTATRDFAEETTIPIEEDEEEGENNPFDDPFGPPTDNPRAHLQSQHSYMTQSTFTDDMTEKEEYYGPAPTGRQERRRGVRQAQMAKKEVRLINGELILECKIPTILHSFLPRRDDNEFTHMRYTAVTCDPDDFTTHGYKLRQNMPGKERETELFICITMYNENEIDFTRTMHGVMRNISHFCSRSKSRTWGKEGWTKIVVCIVSDGRQKIHPRTLDALAAMGVYQDGIAKNLVNAKEVKAHVYEYTTQVSLDADLKFKGAEKGIVPCQMIFCLKERNAKKLNSHRWFFNAFGKALQPNVCILLDVGTKPGPNSLYHLWKAFDNDSNVAGACGEIKAMKGKGWLGLLNPLVASQNFEYKMSNILDKPIESVFGYITVLPGALSAYRYYALQNDSTGHGPLSQYFKGEALHGSNADVFTANMYLAEDRILCWELVAKRDERWVLKYVKSATGETDVPDAVPEFISQRRRWLNGAFFAAVYSLVHFKQIWRTDHTIARKVLLHIEFVYQFIQLLFTWFSLANFYLTFYFVAGSLTDQNISPFGHNDVALYIYKILEYACVLLICTQFILSMGNRPQGARKMFLASMIIYAIIMCYTTFAAIYIVILELRTSGTLNLSNNLFTNIIVSTLSTVGLYFLMSFLYLDPWHMFTSSAQYFALLPSYICTLQIYAFCNTHDISWGTKGDNVIHTDLGAAAGKGGTTGVVELEMPSEQLDIDSGYDEALRNLRDRLAVTKDVVSAGQMQEDYYRAVRTYMVVAWMTTNAVLAMAVSQAYDVTNVRDNVYLTIILWSVAALALFRAVGSSTFGIVNCLHMAKEASAKISEKRMSVPDWVSDSGRTVGSKFSWVSGRSWGKSSLGTRKS